MQFPHNGLGLIWGWDSCVWLSHRKQALIITCVFGLGCAKPLYIEVIKVQDTAQDQLLFEVARHASYFKLTYNGLTTELDSLLLISRIRNLKRPCVHGPLNFRIVGQQKVGRKHLRGNERLVTHISSERDFCPLPFGSWRAGAVSSVTALCDWKRSLRNIT